MLRNQKIRSVEEIEAYKLSVCHPASAGIDLGSRENYVDLNPAIAAEMDLPIVHTFGTTTSQHEACRDLLLAYGVKDICMESTGIYWIKLHYVLTQAGINVCLVNPKMFRMVPGRKTDVLDCQWLQTLHLYGLVRGSFIPDEQTRQLRTYMRLREKLIQDQRRYVQRRKSYPPSAKGNHRFQHSITELQGRAERLLPSLPHAGNSQRDFMIPLQRDSNTLSMEKKAISRQSRKGN